MPLRLLAIALVAWALLPGALLVGQVHAQGGADAPNTPTAIEPLAEPNLDEASNSASSLAGEMPSTADSGSLGTLAGGPSAWVEPQKFTSSMQVMLLLTVLSLAPAVLIMTTSFVRMIVVLGLLRQAIGTQQLPPSQVITSLALFMTLAVMAPVWKQVYDDGVAPYTRSEISLEEAWQRGVQPVRRFMSMQIERTGNSGDIWLLLEDTPHAKSPETYDDVPLETLLPAYMLSELKTAFLIGFQIYLPFLIVDLVVAVVMISMGMLMLPPSLVSLPFKLLLFVMVDGWRLVVGMLMESFAQYV